MKTKKIRIAVVEENSYYNNIIQHQISDLCIAKDTSNLKFDITSLDNVNDLLNSGKNTYQAIIFDNHFKNNKQRAEYNVMEIMDEVKSKNKDCFFISISGYREMTISAYLYKDGELMFSYSKQTAVKNENHEEKCSIPALHKLMDRFIDSTLDELNKTSHRIAA